MAKGSRSCKHGNRRGGKGRRPPLLIGVTASFVTQIILLSVVSYLIGKGIVPIRMASLFGKASFAAAVFLGCFLAVRQAESKKLLYAAAVGFVLLVAVCCICALKNGPTNMRLWVPFAVWIGTALISAALGSKSGGYGYR